MKKHVVLLFALYAFIAPVALLSAHVVSPNAVFTWSTSAGQNGSLKIGMVNGQYFEAEQTNDKNKAAGVIKLYGAILDNGNKVVLLNTGTWKETWEGAVSGNDISGNLVTQDAKYSFKMSVYVPPVSTDPFISGTTLKWETNAGQKGSLVVTSVTGATFTLDMTNLKNVAAGVTKLTGEVKEGKIYLYNKQWSENWVGSSVNGIVTGKINNRYSFKIETVAPPPVIAAPIVTPPVTPPPVKPAPIVTPPVTPPAPIVTPPVSVSIGMDYQGGKIAYILQSDDPGYDPKVPHGLIAATADQSTGVAWAIPANQTTLVTGTLRTIGSGSKNTDKIIAQNGAGTNYAAAVARAYKGGGYTDWYLPSFDELSKVYINRAVLGFFGSYYYWSSSECDYMAAWNEYFHNGEGGWDGGNKNNADRSVRAVRSF